MTCPNCQTQNGPTAKGCRRCLRAIPPLAKGDVVAGRFEILELLGTGGMGVVFKAADRTLDETVALKTLRQDLGKSIELSKRFKSEIRLARRVASPHICRIHEFGIDDGLHYISMEWVDGITVKEFLEQRGGLPLVEAFQIADEIVAGLTAIHQAGIIHRDVKPANLMRTPEGRIKLMDFGIAKELGAGKLTAVGQAVGTPQYMSPEHVMGLDLDPRTDVYTAGLVMFELITGTAVFHGKTLIEIAGKQVQETPDLAIPEIPDRLVSVLQRALSKDRNARYATARELGVALAGVRADLCLDGPSSRGRDRPSSLGAAAGWAPPVDGRVAGHDAPARRSGDREAAQPRSHRAATGDPDPRRAGSPFAGGRPSPGRRPGRSGGTGAIHGRSGPREGGTGGGAGRAGASQGPRRRGRGECGGGHPGQDRPGGGAWPPDRHDERSRVGIPAGGERPHPHRRRSRRAAALELIRPQRRLRAESNVIGSYCVRPGRERFEYASEPVTGQTTLRDGGDGPL